MSFRTTPQIGKWLRGSLFAAIILTAFAQGTVEPWSQLLFVLLSALLLLLWGWQFFTSRQIQIWVPPFLWPLAVFTLYTFFQGFGWKDKQGSLHSLSLDREATLGVGLLLLALVSYALIAGNVFSERRLFRPLVKSLTFYGFALAALALVAHFAASETTYWPRPLARGGFGPFVNRDHFAGYLELLIPMPLALLLTRAVKKPRASVFLLAAVFMGIALIFTLSRGGLLSLLAQLLALALVGSQLGLSFGKQRTPRLRSSLGLNFAVVLCVLLIVGAGVMWLGAEPVVDRMVQTVVNPEGSHTFHNLRGSIWQDTMRIIQARARNLLLGTGVGAFETAYLRYATDDGIGGLTAQAHNDYLQLLADAGLVGGVCLGWFLLVLLRDWRRSLQHRDPWLLGTAIGAGCGVLGIAVHSFFDFNLQLPSHVLLVLVLCALIAQLGLLLPPAGQPGQSGQMEEEQV